MVLYLNDETWKEEEDHGGSLRLWTPRAATLTGHVETVDVFPKGGRLVLFSSSSVYHQVLPLKNINTNNNKLRNDAERTPRLAVSAWMHGVHGVHYEGYPELMCNKF